MNGGTAVVGGIALVYIVYFIAIYSLLFAWLAVSYIFTSKSLHAIARRRGIQKPWLAWVPFGTGWILGCISDQYRYVARGEVKNKRKTLLIMEILTGVCVTIFFVFYILFIVNMVMLSSEQSDALVPMFSSFFVYYSAIWGMIAVSAVYSVFYYMALYDLFYSCDPSKRLIYFFVGMFTSYPLPFFLHVCRNKDLGMPPRQEPEVISPADPGEEI